MTADRHLADGLHEARRGLWPSALESFERAARAAPDDPRPILAAAICMLRMGHPEPAVVRLETSRCPGSVPRSWLICAARLALGDLDGAERAAAGLPARLRARVVAHARLSRGEWQAGVGALLAAHPRRLRGG